MVDRQSEREGFIQTIYHAVRTVDIAETSPGSDTFPNIRLV